MGAALVAWLLACPPTGGGLPQESDPAWERVERGPPAARLEIRESDGATLSAAGENLLRRTGRGTIVLRCTSPGGPGPIRDLASEPAGTTFVAADRGLFAVSPEVEWLDAVQPVGGGIQGKPTSVHVDGRRRVWVATDEAIAVFHSTFSYGHVFGREDGLRSPGPYRVGPGVKGEVLVECREGALRYRPDLAGPVASPRLLVDGKSWPSGALRTLSYGDPLRIAVDPRDAGEGGVLYRIDGHHVWRPLPRSLDLGPLHPGRHTIESVSSDRDLNLSEPCVVHLDVSYPPRYSRGFLLAVGALAGGGAFLGFLLHARRSARPLAAWGQASVSALLLLAVGLQIVAGIVPHARAWPFVGFSMYSHVYREGDVIYRTGIVARGEDVARRGVAPWEAGITYDDPWQVYRPLIVGGDAPNLAFLSALNARHPGDPFDTLQVEAERFRLTPRGPIRVAPLVLSRFRKEGPNAGR
ncbi:MAG: hypothetical protein L0323_01660 [Planctomycetes bacterium]|nr:hypothetical protein [Planctomycetota bacterium]